MKKKETNIVDRFKKLESELISLLVEPFEFNDDGGDEEEKRRLKKYILRVKKAGEVFEKYEATAIEIEKALGAEEEDLELSSTVVDMRENKNQKVMPTKEEYEKLAAAKATKRAKASEPKQEYADEVQVENGAPVLIRKRKRKSKEQSTREM